MTPKLEPSPNGGRSVELPAEGRIIARLPPMAVAAALFLLAVIPYLNSLHNQFVYDDLTQVLSNPYIRDLHHLGEILTTTVWSYKGGANAATNYYRPLMLVQYLLCFRFLGPDPSSFHKVNVFLHALVVIALFMTTERLFKNRTIAFMAAALFAVHPIHTEPVDWIAAVVDLQVSFFCLLAFWFFVGLPGRDRRSNVMAQFGMGTAFALALLSKEIAVAVPLLATLYEHLYRDDRAQTHWTQKLYRYAVLWVLVACYLLLRIVVLGGLLPTTPLRDTSLDEIVLGAIALTGQYLWKFVWPVRLCAFYVFPESLAALLPSVGFGLVILCFSTLLFLLLWKHARPVSFGFLWFLATLAPVLNTRWMASNVFTERYLYLPSVGLCWIVAFGCVRLLEMDTQRSKGLRWAVAAALTALAALCVVRVIVRNRDWRDDVTFYTRTLALSPDSFEMHNNLGTCYYNQGNLKAAEREWLLAQKIDPYRAVMLDNLGLIYMDEGRYDESLGVLERALLYTPNDTDAHINLGLTLAKMARPRAAEREYLAALALSPLSTRAHLRLGELYYDQGRYREAAEQFSASVRCVPTTEALLRGGVAYEQLEAWDQAEDFFKKAVALNPWDSKSHFALGLCYEARGKPSEAMQEYQAGFKLDPDFPEARAAIEQLKAAMKQAKPQ